MVDTVLLAKGISKQYRNKTVLQDISLELGSGVSALLGNNGAGKSTLMKILATALLPSRGTVQYRQFSRPKDDYEIRRILGYLPQQYGLMEHLTPREYLFYVARMKGGSPKEEEFSPDFWLERMGLQESAKRRIAKLSGGMRQRLGIIQALMGSPELLILDEPTAGLDSDERVRFRNLLQELSQSACVLLSTHIVADVEHVAQKLSIMHQGRVVVEGDPASIVAAAVGRVFEMTLSVNEWDLQRADWMDRHQRSYRGVVANIVQEDDWVRVRLVSDNPPTYAEAVDEVGLEDGYLAYTVLGPEP